MVGEGELTPSDDHPPFEGERINPPLQYRHHGGGLLITGDTKSYAGRLKEIGARWIPTLGGWTLGGGREDRFKREFADLL